MSSSKEKTIIEPNHSKDVITIEPSTINSAFVAQKASRSLRITCYGSSSAKTPEAYLQEARSLGYILAKRGHICVNGAGSFGCMAAMNDGAMVGNGHIIGVIHEMFLVDDGYGNSINNKPTVDRDGGAHRVFATLSSSPSVSDNKVGPIREILVAGGSDLQQRKKLLVEKAEGLIVLPGGPGTWDELWEMACARHLGLIDLPIVCINVNEYYTPFQQILHRAYEDELIKLQPHEIVHFASNSEEAIRWIESQTMKSSDNVQKKKSFLRKASALNRSSFLSPDVGIFRRSMSRIWEESSQIPRLDQLPLWVSLGLSFTVGALVGTGMVTFKSR